jgi:hypothetical protein
MSIIIRMGSFRIRAARSRHDGTGKTAAEKGKQKEKDRGPGNNPEGKEERRGED